MTKITPVTQRIEEVSGIRPVTLLVAFGIILITTLLICTGIAANHLRGQALDTTESELGRIDGLLASSARLTFKAADARLAEIAARLKSPADVAALRDAAATPDIALLADASLSNSPHLQAVAVIGTDGSILSRAGAWPDELPASLLAEVKAAKGPNPILGSVVGAQGAAISLPLIHPIVAASGTPVGSVVGLIPATEFSNVFAAAPVATDAVIQLFGADGAMLASYPARTGANASAGERANLDVVFGDPTATMVRRVTDDLGEWRVEAVHALGDYPVAVMVSRSVDQALAGWAHQGIWFGIFALIGALGIGVMVYLIARQFETHSAISSIRAEKIEVERARLFAEAELLKAERLSVLGQLTATVAHELRNPLSAIRNTLFTVKELASNAGLKLDRPIARMERSIERCDRIISDLLEYTRSRELRLVSVPFDKWLSDVIGDQTIPEPVKVGTELGGGDAMVPIDSDRVRRVVINLVENAAQALGDTPAEREKNITVRTRVAGGQMIMTIEDTGPGIAPENLARIFEPLFSTKSFGTGLGLPTVKQIVNQHGGNITVDSTVGRGTTVTVELPLQAVEVESVKVAA
jgi:signal transduction histidine kinase